MRNTLLLIFITVLQAYANDTYSQNTKLTLNLNNVTVANVLEEIQNNSEFYFLFNAKLIDVEREVSISVEDKKISEILTSLFSGTGVNYLVYDRQIILTPSDITSLSAAIQQQKITGTVTGKDGTPITGANVVVTGTTQGTVTDIDGKYSIDVPQGSKSLTFSFIGMVPQEIIIGTSTQINVTLAESSIGLDEVVVIGYGVQRKSDITGSVGSVKAETLLKRPATSVGQVLAGTLAGVNVSVNSGRPGGKPNIRIRGNSSISIANDPLYIIDGVISSIDYLNPNDIASIEVLKDASSTAIYGARGSNGVILVSTKRGNGEGGKVNYGCELSIGTLPREIDVLNSKEWLNAEYVEYQNAQKFDPAGWAAGKYVDPKLKRTNPLLFDANGNPLYDTDWQKEVTQKAFSENHNLSFNGGDAKNNYGIYLGSRNEEGIIKTTYLKRYSVRLVFDSQIKTWLKVGGSLSYNNQEEKQVDKGGSGSSIEVGREMLEQLPIIPVKFPDGSWASNENYPNVESAPNPVQILAYESNVLKTENVLGNVYVNITLAKGLELKTTLGTNILNQQNNVYSSKDLLYISRDQGGIASVTSSQNNSWQFENYMTYNKKISDIHSLTGMLGVSWQHVDYYNFNSTTWGFPDDYFQTNNLFIGSNPKPPTSTTSAYSLNSYFSRINYGFRDKYLLTVSGRVDGSSKFGSSNKYAFFPSAALAWKASNEDFIKSIPVISNLKLRTSYGYTGNSEISPYQALAGLGNYSVIFNNTRVSGIGVGRLPNAELKWEKTGQADFGVELGLFKSRISLEVDLYYKLTNNMLLSAPVPTTSGFSTVVQNVGSVENRGIEFDLNTVNISSKDFSWNTTFNISVNKNKVVSLGKGNADIYPNPSNVSIARVGQPVGSFYGYVRLGTWGTDEAAEAATYFKKPGDLKYQDTNKDGQISAADVVIIGKGIPDGFGSFMNTFRYKNFDLIFDLQFTYGSDVLNRGGTIFMENRVGLANSLATVLNAWTPENQNTPIAQLKPTTVGYDRLNDTRMVQNASFIRGRNLLLGYNFSSELTKKIHLNNLRLTASIQNLFLITRYKGYDPEVSVIQEAISFGQGYINYDFPKPRVFMFGLYVGI